MADSAPSAAPAAAPAGDSASSSSSSSATAAARAAPASSFAHLLPPWFARTVEAYLADDAPAFDIGGLVVGDAPQTAQLLGKSRGVLAGVPFVDAVFAHLGCSVEWLLAEGAVVEPVAVVARVRGPARKILLGERTALNILARASGIATQARRLSDLARAHGWHGEVAGTRKITPGFRLVEKYALLVGGCSTHRMDLSSMVMLKDNHVWAAGGIREAVAAARRAAGFSTKIEVEARNLAEAREAVRAKQRTRSPPNPSPYAHQGWLCRFSDTGGGGDSEFDHESRLDNQPETKSPAVG